MKNTKELAVPNYALLIDKENIVKKELNEEIPIPRE